MTTFNLVNFLKANREQVINEYNNLAKEQFFNGISLKDFMALVMRGMINNNPRSEKRAADLLPHVTGAVYMNNCGIGVDINRDDILAAKYANTQYMALV